MQVFCIQENGDLLYAHFAFAEGQCIYIVGVIGMEAVQS